MADFRHWGSRRRAGPPACVEEPPSRRPLSGHWRANPIFEALCGVCADIRQRIADDPTTRPSKNLLSHYNAIDVAQIIRFVGPDVATRGVSPVPPGYLGMVEDLPTFAPDPPRARALLAEAGHPNGISIRSVVSNISAQQPIMEQVQAQLRRAGITLEMDIVDHPTYHQRIRQDLSALTFYGAARFPVADSYLSQFYHSRSAPGRPTMSLNFAHCDVADDLIDAARVEPDAAKQMAAWAEAQRRIAAAVCSIPLYDLRQVWVRSAKLDYGYTLTGALQLAPAITEATRLLP
jgi:peptide/nickel transport system substrate-binding protein